MRPRPEGRGELDLPELRQHAPLASMRPRPEGRGELLPRSQDVRGGVSLQCGHDPKAVENGTAERPNPDPERRFNAATTRRPWRTPPPSSASKRHPQLQCGHDPKAVENNGPRRRARALRPGFNAATTRRPWRTKAASMAEGGFGRRLQCGHDPKAVENGSSAPPGSPRRCCFNAATTRRPWRTTSGRSEVDGRNHASMRPRPEGRGEPNSASAGRSSPAALQCGHDPKAVENTSRTGSTRRRSSCFNAATTRRPWRTLPDVTLNLGHNELQCGHDPKAVENVNGGV